MLMREGNAAITLQIVYRYYMNSLGSSHRDASSNLAWSLHLLSISVELKWTVHVFVDSKWSSVPVAVSQHAFHDLNKGWQLLFHFPETILKDTQCNSNKSQALLSPLLQWIHKHTTLISLLWLIVVSLWGVGSMGYRHTYVLHFHGNALWIFFKVLKMVFCTRFQMCSKNRYFGRHWKVIATGLCLRLC